MRYLGYICIAGLVVLGLIGAWVKYSREWEVQQIILDGAKAHEPLHGRD